MSPLTVTAVILNYNHGTMLDEAIDSVVRQTRRPDRIVVLDDASTDGSTHHALRHGVDLIMQQPNQGLTATWQNAMLLPDTDLVCVLHGDDRWQSGFIEAFVDAMERHPNAGFFVTNATVHYDGSTASKMVVASDRARRWRHGGLSSIEDFHHQLQGHAVYPCSWGARRSALDQQQLDTSMRWCMDWLFWCQAFSTPGAVVVDPTPHGWYRRHTSSASFTPEMFRVRIAEERSVLDRMLAEVPVEAGARRVAERMLQARYAGFALQAGLARGPAMCRQVGGEWMRSAGATAPFQAALGIARLLYCAR